MVAFTRGIKAVTLAAALILSSVNFLGTGIITLVAAVIPLLVAQGYVDTNWLIWSALILIYTVARDFTVTIRKVG